MQGLSLIFIRVAKLKLFPGNAPPPLYSRYGGTLILPPDTLHTLMAPAGSCKINTLSTLRSEGSTRLGEGPGRKTTGKTENRWGLRPQGGEL